MQTKYQRLIIEGFEVRKWKEGTVKFSESKLTDPHIQKILAETARITNRSVKEIEDDFNKKLASFSDIAAKAPILYGTILKNIIEDESFKLMEEHSISSPTCPKFNRNIFQQLVTRVKADHEQFYPLRSFLNHKRLYDAATIFTDNPDYPEFADIPTACATPNGIFAFNAVFCQRLMELAHLKQVKPKGKKYQCNGGNFPDEYCYCEFAIIHEFMHYTYDDFHYQKIIPNADPDIINWVGDFRTNYLLVKSGYEQLPMGLFNDKINYDRQSSYKEMYDLVESEFKKLNNEQQQRLKKALDEMGDDHQPGQEKGKEMDEGGEGGQKGKGEGEGQEGEGEGEGTGGSGNPWDKIDKQNEKTEGQMKDAKDKDTKEAADDLRKRDEERAKQANDAKKGGRGSNKGTSTEMDYTKVAPKHDWRSLLRLLLPSNSDKVEESRLKPSRRGISGLHVAAQLGAGALPPSEIPLDLIEAKICFCIDNSGSMTSSVQKIYSNIYNLLATNDGLRNCEMTLIKFSNDHTKHKILFNGDKAAHVINILDKPSKWDSKLSAVFKDHPGGATNFTDEILEDLKKLLEKNYNILIVSDDDIIHGENYNILVSLLNSKKGRVFVLFDTKKNYEDFLKKGNFTNFFVSFINA
jgi:hypothetical protein